MATEPRPSGRGTVAFLHFRGERDNGVSWPSSDLTPYLTPGIVSALLALLGWLIRNGSLSRLYRSAVNAAAAPVERDYLRRRLAICEEELQLLRGDRSAGGSDGP